MTTTASARTAKKATTKKVAAKRTPAAGAAKKSVKKAPARRTASPVMFNGEPAANRHFMLDRDLYQRAMARCGEDGINLSDVLRHGIDMYGKKAPKAEQVTGPKILPRSALAALKKMYRTGDAKTNEYLAALHRNGWTVQSLADSLVATGLVDKMSRQAVSLRILKAPEVLSDDLPPVPDLGPRRSMASPRRGKTLDQYQAKSVQGRANTYDLSFRVTDSAYERALRRAKHEGAMMSGVLDEVLKAYLAGEYDKTFVKQRAAQAAKVDAAAPAKKTVAKKTVAKKTTATRSTKKATASKR